MKKETPLPDSLVEKRLRYIERQRELHSERVNVVFEGRAPQGSGPANRHGMPKLPTGQRQVPNWPVLDLGDVPDVSLDAWRLEVSGLVRKPGEYTLDDIRALPKIVQNTRHVCVEGWAVIGSFGGSRVADFLTRVGADESARFLELRCADDYYESVDMASIRHPQSLLCYEMYGAPLTRTHGAPLRLVMPTKLGYKQAKYIVGLRVSNVLPAASGYWEDQGYSWHGGL